ncbi:MULTISPECIES: hypothetical protein [unclassified Bacillus cereus group]|uniref:hypothetical protein n=1 Tax=unclassified Bacillus cereus group TaxID=2750818 RepID=UPI001F5A5DF6
MEISRKQKLEEHDLRLNHFFKIKNILNNKVATTPTHPNFGLTYNMSVGSSLNDATEQQWIIYPVDGNRYILANRLTGTVATVSPEHLNPDNMLTEFYTGYNGQYWLAQKIQNSNYKLKNNLTGKVATISKDGPNANNMITDASGNGLEQQWALERVEDFLLPDTPSLATDAGPVPRYETGQETLPKTTPKKLVGYTLVPAVMVKDNDWDPAYQINESPYYILKRYQYWLRLIDTPIDPLTSTKTHYSYGIETDKQVTNEQTIGFSISTDAGMNFKAGTSNKDTGATSEFGVTSDIKQQFHQELKMTISTTNKQMESYSVEKEVVNPYRQAIQYAKYILATDLELYRYSKGSESLVMTTSFSDQTYIKSTSYPFQINE